MVAVVAVVAVVLAAVVFFFISYLYTATCGPKGRGLRQMAVNTIYRNLHDWCHLRQSISYPTALVGHPFPPNHRKELTLEIKETKEKDERKKKNILGRPWPALLATNSLASILLRP